MFFFYQQKGGNNAWQMDVASRRQQVIQKLQPAFVSVLDLSSVPEDSDWSKTKYVGPLYFDFDAAGDLDLVCEKFKEFLEKLAGGYDFDLHQARLFASGGKGFHIEVPYECLITRPNPAGFTWLPYIYDHMAKALVVDTLDLRVYSGRKGRMWRTPGVKRENGNYKVPLTVEEALNITPDDYLELVSEPRYAMSVIPPHTNAKLSLLFEQAKTKVSSWMRGKKKRVEKANKALEPWKKANKNPPSIEKLMSGEIVKEGAGFQQLSMQLSIYATSVGMELDEFLTKCEGLIKNHRGDGKRYNTEPKRREELARMHRYMSENDLYEYDVGPVLNLIKRGVSTPDLGVIAEDREEAEEEKDNAEETPVDHHRTNRRGFFMNHQGMFKRVGDNTPDSVCRATLMQIEAFYNATTSQFVGFEFDLVVPDRRPIRTQLAAEAFTSTSLMRKFFAAYQLSFQGGDAESLALLDIMSEKAAKGGRIYVYPREGFMVMNNPEANTPDPVRIYLTQETFLSSLREEDPKFFRLRYRPENVVSAYGVDLHKAPKLHVRMARTLKNLFIFNKVDVVADLVGWMVAAHYRSWYLYAFKQFPNLQVYGEAGAGKTKSIETLARLHWFMKDISVKSCLSCTPFALDTHASTSTSAPLILDEYKPRDLIKARLDKLRDTFKAAYIGGDIGERGTINKGPESNLSIIKSRATAPIIFLAEAIEPETAIQERCISVGLSKAFQTRSRTEAFECLRDDTEALPALGRAIIEFGFDMDLNEEANLLTYIRDQIEAVQPDHDDPVNKRMATRMIYNRAVVLHALNILKRVLQGVFGPQFDENIDNLIDSRTVTKIEHRDMTTMSMSELSKVMTRIALLTREDDERFAMRRGRDYIADVNWVEFKVEKSYDNYRRYCVSVGETPLFDSMHAFVQAMYNYSPVVDKVCAGSELRKEGSTELVMKMSAALLKREGVHAFRN